MESSKSKSFSNRVKNVTQSRSSLFYDKWIWSVSWHQPEISTLRNSLDEGTVNYLFDRKRIWEKNHWDLIGSHALRPTYRSAITQQVQQNVHTVRQWLLEHKDIKKIFPQQGKITVFTNDCTTIDSALAMCQPFVNGRIVIKKAEVDVPAGVQILKKPYDYTHRTYLRSRELNENTRHNLKQWAKGMDKAVKLCPSFRDYLHNKRSSQWHAHDWTFSHYFVDHCDPKLTVWINIVAPGLVRKTVSLQSPAK